MSDPVKPFTSKGMGMDIPRKKKSKLPRYATYAAVAVVLVGGATVGLSRLRAAAPSVGSSTTSRGRWS